LLLLLFLFLLFNPHDSLDDGAASLERRGVDALLDRRSLSALSSGSAGRKNGTCEME
jgi:hypothetical protein